MSKYYKTTTNNQQQQQKEKKTVIHTSKLRECYNILGASIIRKEAFIYQLKLIKNNYIKFLKRQNSKGQSLLNIYLNI